MAQGSWERIGIPSDRFLREVFFIDSITGWVVGDSGTILHTADGGLNWEVQQSNTYNDIVTVFFLDHHRGWASTYNYASQPYGTVLLKTVNGGADWIAEPYPQENIFITCILFQDTLTGWMGGMPHALVKTVNGGADWVQASIDTSVLAFFPVLGIKFYNEKYGYACGGMFDIAGVTWHTSNGGETWAAMDVADAPADEVHQLHLFDSITVLGAGGDPDFGYGVGLLRTTDGGFNWDYEELGIQGTAYDIAFRTGSEAWAPLGPRRKLMRSIDSGNTWTESDTPDTTVIYHITFPDSLHGYAAGMHGAFLKYKPAGNLSAPPGSQNAPGLILGQNYPNPVSQSTVIPVSVPEGEPRLVAIRILDILGRPVDAPFNAVLHQGKHEIPFNAKALPAGVYFIILETADGGRNRVATLPVKMTVVK